MFAAFYRRSWKKPPLTPSLNLNCHAIAFAHNHNYSPQRTTTKRLPFLTSTCKSPQYFQQRNMESAGSASTVSTGHTNRLAQEKSPYLLQHAHNPVDWYPWGEEAIERARRENKLIFLSVGYSTCHWCHVMEHESFENQAVADIMNEHFINVKVDREERPDIDKIYMNFLLMTKGSGGWPMSVWLTPDDLAPITAGTYFPPDNRWGIPSFSTVLKTIAAKWAANQDHLKTTGLHVIEAIKKASSERSAETTEAEHDCVEAKLQQGIRVYKQRYDQQHGGFGTKPKFPEVSRLNLLFHAYAVTKNVDVLDMALQTLRHIGKGGINDHVFGGFARYAVDREWHVPHFEKMLYDQGQLLSAYSHAYKVTCDSQFLHYADGIFRYLMKDLRHPAGGFYAGEDADSLPTADSTKKVEGAFYAWEWEEVKAEIEKNASSYSDMEPGRVMEIYAFHYDLQPEGNVDPSSDPHGHLNTKNILIVRGSEADTCSKFEISKEKLAEILDATNQILHALREKRPRPHLDTKIICAWNGLTLSGLAKLADCSSTKSEEYLNAAEQLVTFARTHFFDTQRKLLLRSCYGVGTTNSALEEMGAERIDGFLDDYAFLVKGLLDYYKASLDDAALEWAKQLQDIQDTLFWDSENGAYFYSQANSPNIIVRMKEDHDGAEPSGNSVAARNLILLGHYFDDAQYTQRAEQLFRFFTGESQFCYVLPEMMSALLLHNGLDLVVVVGPDTPETHRFVQICRQFYIPGIVIIRVDPQRPKTAHNARAHDKFKMISGKPTVYICHNKVCRMPVTDPATLEANLRESFCRSEN